MAENESNNLQVAEEPEFTKEIPGIDPEDPVHFAQMNGILEKLLGNDVFLDKLANKMIEKNLIAHVLDCENAQMVLGADQAPVITGLIDGVKEDVTQLYSDIRKVIEIVDNPSQKDINKYTKTGFYAIGNIGGYTNLPVQSAGILIVFSTGSYFFQIYSTVVTNLLYYRSGENNRFNPWTAIA